MGLIFFFFARSAQEMNADRLIKENASLIAN